MARTAHEARAGLQGPAKSGTPKKPAMTLLRSVTARHRAPQASLDESERRFRAMAHSIPVMMWVADVDGTRTFFNRAWLDFTGRSSAQALGDGWQESLHPGDRRNCLGTYLSALRARKRFRTEYRLKRHNGEYRWILETGVPRFKAGRTFAGYIGSAIDVTERKRAKELEVGQKKFLEMVATGKPLPETLDLLTQLIEEQSGEAFCAVMLLDERKQNLRLGSAPRLPESYRREIDGIAVGCGNGSCAMAAFRRRSVVVSDIANNPLWANIRDIPLTHGLKACASVPILANGRALGTCAMYYQEARKPGRYDMKLLRIGSQLLTIAIERRSANGRCPARPSRGDQRNHQADALDDGDRLAAPIGDPSHRQRAAQQRKGERRGEIEITHAADREHPIGDGLRLYHGYREHENGKRIDFHVETRAKSGSQSLAPGRPSIGTVEHQSGPGNGGKEPSFRPAERRRLDRSCGNQAGDCRPDERDAICGAEAGVRMVRGDPAFEGEKQAGE